MILEKANIIFLLIKYVLFCLKYCESTETFYMTQFFRKPTFLDLANLRNTRNISIDSTTYSEKSVIPLKYISSLTASEHETINKKVSIRKGS